MSQASSTVATSSSNGKTRTRTRIRKSNQAATAKVGSTDARTRRFAEAVARTDTISLETARRLCPNATVAIKMSVAFGLDPVDGAAVMEQTEAAVAASAKALDGSLNETALRIHMQRVVDGFVRSAHGAGNFYDTKAKQARELSSAVFNEDRDEDRMGVDGMANKAERARDFAAIAGLQAHALFCAAEGAASAFAHITGEEWKPYARQTAHAVSGQRKAVSAQLDALG